MEHQVPDTACRLCGCTEHHACHDEERGACAWVELSTTTSTDSGTTHTVQVFDDLCTHCADSVALLHELVTGTGRSAPIVEGAEYGSIEIPVHHAEQLDKILQYIEQPGPGDCPVCAKPFRPNDMCLTDIEMGTCHAECLRGSTMVDLDTGEPLPAGSPPPQPFRYGDEPALRPDEPALRPEDLPDPTTLVEYPDGSVSALMFHYMPEETPLKPVAIAQGYECRSLTLDSDPGADELFRRYEDDQEPAAILRDWHPVPPDGWQLGAKFDSEDGPLAMFIRKAGQ